MDALSLPGSLEPPSPETEAAAASPAPEIATDTAAWSPARRFGFRLAAVYFVLYVLLFFKRTRLLGALVVVGVMSNVVMLNYAYDVPVKLFSTHLLLLAVGLAALDARRLAAFFFRNEPAPPAEHPPLFRAHRANLAARALGLALLATVVWTYASQGWSGYHTWGAGRPRPALWGIHDVETFTADAELLPPLLTDEVRWRTLVVDRALPMKLGDEEWPGFISVRRMDGTLQGAAVELDEDARTITRLPPEQKSVAAAREAGVEVTDVLRWDRPEPDRLVLRGRWDGREIEVHLRERDLGEMELTGRGYHWINELPYNR